MPTQLSLLPASLQVLPPVFPTKFYFLGNLNYHKHYLLANPHFFCYKQKLFPIPCSSVLGSVNTICVFSKKISIRILKQDSFNHITPLNKWNLAFLSHSLARTVVFLTVHSRWSSRNLSTTSKNPRYLLHQVKNKWIMSTHLATPGCRLIDWTNWHHSFFLVMKSIVIAC